MDRFKALGIPADIIALIKNPPLLEGESKEEFFAFLAGLFEDHGGSNRIRFLGLIRYAHCYWPIPRLELARARIIGHWQPKASIALIRDHHPEAYKNFDELLKQQYPNGVDSALLNARAILLANEKKHLAYLDQELERRSRECEKILQSLAFANAVFAPRRRGSKQ